MEENNFIPVDVLKKTFTYNKSCEMHHILIENTVNIEHRYIIIS